jgi:hypothetical protein
VIGSGPAGVATGSASTSWRRRSASRRASTSRMPGMQMPNSSPPNRPSPSLRRWAPVRISARAGSSASPADAETRAAELAGRLALEVPLHLGHQGAPVRQADPCVPARLGPSPLDVRMAGPPEADELLDDAVGPQQRRDAQFRPVGCSVPALVQQLPLRSLALP